MSGDGAGRRGVGQWAARLSALSEGVWGRVIAAVVVFSATMAAYGWLNRSLTPRVTFYTPLDAWIPLIPWTITVYFSHYGMLLWGAARARAPEFARLLLAVLTVNCLCYVGFIALPAHYPRPDPAQVGSPWGAWFAWAFSQDGPGNTFPSLHVAVTWYLVLWRWRRPDRWLWAAWGVAIAASTLTVKQHFIADVVGGVALAHAVEALWARAWPASDPPHGGSRSGPADAPPAM